MLKANWPVWIAASSVIAMLIVAALMDKSRHPSIYQDQQVQWGQTQQQPESPAKGESDAEQQQSTSAKSLVVVEAPPSGHLNEERQNYGQHGGEEATEAWTIFGMRFKITDTLLTAFTLFLVVIGAWQGHAIYRQIDLGREEFTATNRPKLVVRELLILGAPTSGRPIKIRYVIANVGASRAKIVESHIETQRITDDILRPLQPIEGDNTAVGDALLEPGQLIFRECQSTLSWQDFINEIYGTDGSIKLYFRGFVVYTDWNGLKRRTAFCRQYDFGARRFRIIDDPDYEYAD
jgi:hypothetical protein